MQSRWLFSAAIRNNNDDRQDRRWIRSHLLGNFTLDQWQDEPPANYDVCSVQSLAKEYPAMIRPRPQRLPYPFIPPFDPSDEEPPYIPPESSGGEGEGSSSEDPGPRPPWWPEDWPWPPPPDEPVAIEAPPPLPNIIWPRLPPDHHYHLPPGYHYPDMDTFAADMRLIY